MTRFTIECRQGDIANQTDMDAVVNAANALLRTGGGVAGALHRAAGPGLAEECAPMAPIEPGQAVISGGHRLPNRHVIHCLGPVYGRDEPADRLLADCYRNALRLAEARGLESVAFPALSTGAFGYPLAEAARIAVTTVAAEGAALERVKRVRFVLFDDAALAAHREVLDQLPGQRA
ncbi:macro domain-containing protein [Alloalcanivorax profundimaris]|uniref:macro domain-containing protein n=1 Tax=Alloalcanivorax profundimaris TaxID=2735259 RepID=UPI0018870896|nr:macro domain-containing protein [Alloalcanivorax profundimaris]MBF1802238.1 macro domain-containing protein [Alloalcanivorax profundimaris]MCQ6261002.1 macro domain-containing protein [Alcanivorax sp. MM125-6]